MKISRTKNAVRNIFFGFISKIYQTVMPFIMRWLMIHYMGVQYLGLNGLFTSILQVLNLAELGVGTAMVYSMYKPIAENDHEKICALMKLYKKYYSIIGWVVAVVGIILLPGIPKLIKGDVPVDINVYILYFLNLGASVFSYWLFAYRNSILQAYQRLDVASRVLLFTDTVKYIIQFAAIIAWKDYYIYTTVIVATQVLSNVITAYYSKKIYPIYSPQGTLEKQEIDAIKQRIKDVFTSRLGAVVVNSADVIVISAFMGLTALAIYQNYYYIITIVFSFVMVCMDACVAGIGNSLVTESVDKNYEDFKGFSFGINWICCGCICCFINLFQPFMKIYAGEENLLPGVFVILFSVYFYIYTLTNYWCVYKNAAGIWHSDRFRPLVGAILNLVLNLLTVNQWGLYAILASTIVSYILVTMPWLLVNLLKQVFIRRGGDYLVNVFGQIFIIIGMGIASYFACSVIELEGILDIFVRGILCAIIGFGGYGIIFVRSKELKFLFDLLKKVKN